MSGGAYLVPKSDPIKEVPISFVIEFDASGSTTWETLYTEGSISLSMIYYRCKKIPGGNPKMAIIAERFGVQMKETPSCPIYLLASDFDLACEGKEDEIPIPEKWIEKITQ